jgi:hypothetical protein
VAKKLVRPALIVGRQSRLDDTTGLESRPEVEP